jgi:hypothetical protein
MNEQQLVSNELEEPPNREMKIIEPDWTESEWFQVWLKLARQNHEECLNAS